MGSGLTLTHAGSLLLLRCRLFLLKIFPSSVLTSYDLTSTWCSTRALNHLPDLSVGFTRTISPSEGRKLLRTDVVVLGLQLFSLQELSLDILDYLGFEKLTGRRNQCPSAATNHSLSGGTL